jgi:DNA-binding SARP family transcriptional activator
MDFRILGPVEGSRDGLPLPLGGPRQRALLAFLLLHPDEVISADRLLEELWWEPPPSRAAALQTQVSRLRKAVGDDRIVTESHGYALRVEDGELDLQCAQSLIRASAVAEDPAERAR